MNPSIIAFLGYIGWFIILIVVITGQRTFLTLAGNRVANSFKPEGSDISEFSARLCRAHANCYESFPFIGGLLLFALATDQTMITNPLAIVVLCCRIAQSVTHVISSSVIGVQIRFMFFLGQLGISFYWMIQFASN